MAHFYIVIYVAIAVKEQWVIVNLGTAVVPGVAFIRRYIPCIYSINQFISFPENKKRHQRKSSDCPAWGGSASLVKTAPRLVKQNMHVRYKIKYKPKKHRIPKTFEEEKCMWKLCELCLRTLFSLTRPTVCISAHFLANKSTYLFLFSHFNYL